MDPFSIAVPKEALFHNFHSLFHSVACYQPPEVGYAQPSDLTVYEQIF